MSLGLLVVASPCAAEAAQTSLGNGVPTASATVCPGTSGRKLDGFSLVNDLGSVPVTGLTVTTTGYPAIQAASIQDEAGTTQYFATVSAPASNTLIFSGGTPLPVSTTTANFKVVVTYRSEAQSPPAGSTTTTAVVSALTTANSVAGGDTADATVALDNVTPMPGATWGATPAGNGQVTLNWTLGMVANSALVVRYTANTDTTLPVDGTTYTVGAAFGAGGVVRYVGSSATFVDTGLTNGTTYYFRIFEFDGCNNYVASAVNAPWSLALTPAAAPTVTTGAATLLTGTTAQLNGSANPNGSATNAWFRYATVSPGTCNDSFGTRAPASGGTLLGSGTGTVAYSVGITGLTAGVTYYACAIAQNSSGTTSGAVLSFVTPMPPAAATQAASSLTVSSASLNGTATPNGAATTSWFRFSTTSPGTCNDTFGTRAPSSGGTALGSGYSAVAFSQMISGLSAGTTYYYCSIATSAEGIAFGNVLSLTTAGPPTATTGAATLVTANTATLNGSANPGLDAAYGYFRYSTTNPVVCNDTFGARLPASSSSDTSLGAGGSPVAFSFPLSGLTPGTTYYACVLARNAYGTAFGAIVSFTTAAAVPTVTTSAATLLTGTTAQLNGSANPGGASTTGWFRYATVSPGTCNDSFGTRAPAAGGSSLGSGNVSTGFSQGLVSLTPGTTYYLCAIAQNSVGLAYGAVLSFVTPMPPAVTTQAVTSLTTSSANLNGSANPNLSPTTGYFRYSTTDPGTCNDTFGSRAPVTGGTSLGSGSSVVAFTQSLSGLSPATTYFACAIAQSAEGTGFGTLVSFTTAGPPTATTGAASAVAATSASLNGDGTPNLTATTGWFRYSATDPGTCSDAFGIRIPSSSASDSPLGAGSSPVPFSQGVSGLVPGATYYACALTQNAYGTGYGAVVPFTTAAAAPTVTTGAATLLTGTTAQLNASANPGGASTTGWFRYATVSPGSCNDSFGTRAPASGGSTLGSGTSTAAFSLGISGLSPGTTYYLCAIAQNSVGLAFGNVLAFTTLVSPPTTATSAASSVTSTSATLNGSANPNLSPTTGWFRYATIDPGTCSDTFGTRAPATGGATLGSGNTAVSFSQAISGLSPGTTYYACAVAQNAGGNGFGAVVPFSTPQAPVVTSDAPSSITTGGATLNGSADPGGDTATGWFRYATVSPGTCNDSFGTRAPAAGGTPLGGGRVTATFNQPVSGLSPGTTYYACAIAQNGVGTGFGAVVSFTTPQPPSVSTGAASGMGATGATLNGTANPHGAAAAGWFRFSPVNPGACDDTFGGRAPASGGVDLGTGEGDAAFSQTLTGLTPGTTYYACAIAGSANGTSFGAVITFATLAAPAVVTDAPTDLTASSATLRGTATPNLAAATGWFRWSVSDPLICDDVSGTRSPASGGTDLGTGSTPVPFGQPIAGLRPATTYWSCALAQNAIGLSVGAPVQFTTSTAAPEVVTGAPTLVTNDAALLHGTAVPNGADTVGWFRWSASSPGACDDTFGARAPATGGTTLGAGTGTVAFEVPLAGLSRGVTYWYCAIAANADGTSFGALQQVIPGSTSPAVATLGAGTVTAAGATLAGSVDPRGSATTGWFQYGDTLPTSCDQAYGARLPAAGGADLGAGNGSVALELPVAGLLPNATYWYCAAAANVGGATFGEALSFTTDPVPPGLTTSPVAVAAGTVTLQGLADPRGTDTTAWFRYAASDPGACDDAFGTRWPAQGGTAVGAGRTRVAYADDVTGLAPGRYWACAIGRSTGGTGFGALVTFEVAAPAPSPGGCGCRTATGDGALALLLGLLALWPRRRRAR